MKAAVFLDKDGTLINDVPYNVDPSKISFVEDAFSALRDLQQNGFKLFLISNQPGIAFNYFNEEALIFSINHIINELSNNGIRLDGFYYCPHHPEGVNEFKKDCSCRKPLDGLIRQAAYENEIDLQSSWMVGDILNDTEAGNRAGCKTVLIDNGNETEWILSDMREPNYKVQTLSEAANIIIMQTQMHEQLERP
jgi:D-glycero-D-manno-heptose 1,7-bisphosphate phosphatase